MKVGSKLANNLYERALNEILELIDLYVGKRKDNNRYYLYDINYREWFDVEL